MSDQLLWFTTRAAGTVSLILLSGVVVIGLLARLRLESPRWPRFLTAELHGQLALMTLVFLMLHIITAVVDPFTSLASFRSSCPSVRPTGRYGSASAPSPSSCCSPSS